MLRCAQLRSSLTTLWLALIIFCAWLWWYFFEFKACRIITALYSKPAEQRWVKNITMPEKKLLCVLGKGWGERTNNATA